MKGYTKVVMALATVALLQACASRPAKPSSDAQLAAATKAEFDCAMQAIPAVDDGKSDAATIALSVSLRCNPEYYAAADVVAATLDNDAQRRAFYRIIGTPQHRVESFLSLVLQYRQQHK